MIEKIGLQLYSIRDFMTTEEDVRDSFARIKKMGYDQVQARGFLTHEKLAELAREAGLEIIGTHVDIDEIENNLEEIRKLGTSNVGVGWGACDSVEETERFIERANKVAQTLSKYGIKFTYHHHSHEFVRFENEKTAMDMLIEGLDSEKTSFVLDTYWIQHGGGDVRYWIEKLAGRVDILHLKDMKRGTNPAHLQLFAEVGSGNMNWKGIIESAEKAGVKYYVVEQDADWYPNCFASVRKSAEYIRENFMR